VTLASPHLDDLTWDAMVEAARRRIPAESRGEWTLHAPTDPGVTLVELFAYLLEQRLYWLDQVPDELVMAVLRLLGLPPPLPARPAATVLRLTAESPDGLPVVVPAGTVLSRDPTERIAFTLVDDVTVLPFTDLRLMAGAQDRTADLVARRGVPLLPATGRPGGFAFALRREGAAERPPRGTRLSLLFELDAPAQCPPSWSPDAVDRVPPPAELSFFWFRPDADEDDGPGLPVSDVVDGTAGLRRSGIVSVPLPDQWCAGGGGETPQEYGLRVRTKATTYATPPVLLALAPNAGAARHREERVVTDAELAAELRAWLRLAGQHLTLPDARGLLLEATLRIRRGGEAQEWTPAPALTFGGPADRLFLVDRESGELRFGDGLTGAIPVPDPPDPAGEPVVEVAYVLGGGAAGNGGLTANWFPVRPIDGGVVVAASNVVPAAGGRDAETIAQARTRAGEELARVHRAVTAADFTELADGTPGVAVARSYAGIGQHPAYPCTTVPGAVTVRVVPDVSRDDAALAATDFVAALRPDPGTLAAVRARLADARLVGTEVFVCPPRYRRVDLRVDLAGRPADPAAVSAALRVGLRRYLDPVVGGDDGTGWPFGGPLRPSGLSRAAQAAVAGAAEVAAVAVGLDGATAMESCADVPLRPGELAALEQISVRVVRAGEGGAPMSERSERIMNAAGWEPHVRPKRCEDRT
jgi:hypothetical protein